MFFKYREYCMDLKRFLAILAFFLLAAKAFPQSSMSDRSNYFNSENNFNIEIFQTPNESLDSLSFIFLYRLPYSELVFEKKSENKYLAILAIEATFKDSDNITRKRFITSDSIFTDNFEETTAKNVYFVNLHKLTLAMNNYHITAKMLKAKTQKLNAVEIDVKNYALLANQQLLLEPVFVKATENKDKYAPFIANNFIPFAHAESLKIFIPASFDMKNSTFEFIISHKNDNDKKEIWGEFQNISGACKLLKNKYLHVLNSGNNIEIELKDIEYQNKNNDIGLLEISLNATKFTPGFYELKIKNVRTNEEKTSTFEVRWDDVPLSLINSNYAVDKMLYILTDDELSNMKKGNQTEKYKKIIEYWKKQDPTPKTPYNEAMTEYFRRVDHAFFNFQTITEKDGAKTDRGMIYILYGMPDAIESSIVDKTRQEIWIYKRLSQSYIFDIVSVGNYKLSTIKDL